MSTSGGYVNSSDEIEILKEISYLSCKDNCHLLTLQIVKNIHSHFPHVRTRCLKLIGQYLEPSVFIPGGTSTFFEAVQWFTEDNDSRVREAVFNLYLQWLERDLILPDSSLIYELAQIGLSDGDDEVVITCLRLITKISVIQPNLEILIANSNQKVRLSDKVFCHVGCAMTHGSVRVRTVAAELLSQVEQVSELLLLETLEKTVMVDKVIKKSQSDRINAVSRMFWIDDSSSFGKRLGTTTTAEDALEMGVVTGAVISGLEDDFYENRVETILTIGKLCKKSEKFSLSCQDLLVDMLTDDIDIVRSTAVKTLSLASCGRRNVVLRSDHLDVVLGALREKSGSMRRSIHELLGICRLASANALMRLTYGLLKNLEQYEIDKDSIWRCFSFVGRNHPEFVQVNLKSLCRIHPYLSVPETPKSDPAYIAALLMVINASRQLPSIKSYLPNHVKAIEIYINELVPELIFDKVASSETNGDDQPQRKIMKFDENETEFAESKPNLYAFLRKTVKSLHEILSGNAMIEGRNNNMLQLLLQDLRQISRICDETRGLCLWLRDLGLLAKMTQQLPLALNRLRQAEFLAYKMIYAYTGISDSDVQSLMEFISVINKKMACIQAQDILPTRETKEILSKCPSLAILASLSLLYCFDDSKATSISQFKIHPPTQVIAKQLHPSIEDTEKSAIKFNAGMSVSLPVRAVFSGLQLTSTESRISVQTPVVVIADRPDGKSLYWHPSDHSWTTFDESTLLGCQKSLYLDTDVHLSFNEWSEAGVVHLSLGVKLPCVKEVFRLTDPVPVKIFPICSLKAM